MGRKFRSGFEETVDMQLRSSGVAYSYEDTKIPYILECEYTPDFRIKDILIETKGRLLPEDRRKHLVVKKQHPHLDIRFVFMYPDRKMPNAKMTHETWATRHGFKYAVGRIPEEWLNE